jgi:hypothetical protein
MSGIITSRQSNFSFPRTEKTGNSWRDVHIIPKAYFVTENRGVACNISELCSGGLNFVVFFIHSRKLLVEILKIYCLYISSICNLLVFLWTQTYVLQRKENK